MGKKSVDRKILWMFMAVFLLSGCASLHMTTVETQAAVKDGWVKKDEIWYYYQDGKKVKDDWIRYNRKYYYLKPGNGMMAENEFILSEEDGQRYYVDRDGVMATGWKKIKKKWYFFRKKSPRGAMRYGWFSEKNASGGKDKYYLNKSSGAMYTDKLFKVNKKYYYATESGKIFNGWKTIDGKKYHFTLTGTLSLIHI